MRLLLVLILTMPGHSVNAQDLGIRRSASGEHEAVLTMHVGGCGPFVTPTESVVVSGGEITIVGSDFGPVICGVPPPGFDDTAMATLGSLPPGRYEMSWTQPNFFSVSIVFVVPSAPVMVPFSSPALMVVLAVLLLLVALQANYASKPTADNTIRSSEQLRRSSGLARH